MGWILEATHTLPMEVPFSSTTSKLVNGVCVTSYTDPPVSLYDGHLRQLWAAVPPLKFKTTVKTSDNLHGTWLIVYFTFRGKKHRFPLCFGHALANDNTMLHEMRTMRAQILEMRRAPPKPREPSAASASAAAEPTNPPCARCASCRTCHPKPVKSKSTAKTPAKTLKNVESIREAEARLAAENMEKMARYKEEMQDEL